MTTEEKKKELQQILATADDELTNVLMEAATEYQTASKEDFVVPQEWIEEFEQRSKDLRNGKDKGLSHEETMLLAKQKLAELKKKHNHAL